VRTEVVNFSEANYSAGSVIVTRQSAEYDMNKLSTDEELEAYRGYKIGVVSGSIWDQVAQERIPDGQIRYYNSNTDLVIALDTGKIDGYITDEPTVRILRRNYSSHVVGAVINQYSYAYIFQKDNAESKVVCDQLDEYLAKIKADGTLEKLDDIWFGTDTTLQNVDYTGLSGENGTLKFNVFSGAGAPFVYIQNGEFVGYDVDIAVRFCKEYGYGIEIIDTDFSGILARIATGQSDFGGSSICVTAERQESVLFSEANYVGGGVLVIKTDSSVEASAIGFWQSLINSFNKTFIRENRWKMFANGLGTTVLITLISAACGTIIGFASFLIYRKKHKVFKGLVNILSGILHKTPVVVILMILYYLIFGDFAIGGIGVSCIGFSIIFACSVNSLLKVAVDAVDSGQMEAAKALGYSDGYGFIKVIIPQALRHFLPGYKGEIVSLIKETAIVGYIAVQDLTKVGDIVRSRTYDAFFPLIASAVLYFIVAGILEVIIDRIQFSIDPKHRRYERVLRGVKTK